MIAESFKKESNKVIINNQIIEENDIKKNQTYVFSFQLKVSKFSFLLKNKPFLISYFIIDSSIEELNA